MAHLLRENKCCQNVSLVWDKGPAEDKWHSSVFEDVSFRSNEALSLLGAPLIEVKRYEAQQGDAVHTWKGGDLCRGRGSEWVISTVK